MTKDTSLAEITAFISEYIAILMGSGVHTSRVVRNTKRIAESLGVEMTMSAFHMTVILSVGRASDSLRSSIVEIPSLPINFRINSELSGLSWEAYDNPMPLEVLKEKFERIVAKPRLDHNVVLLMAGAANACFCKLFGGDWLSALIVFIATLAGFTVRSKMQKREVNHHITVVVAAFVASITSAVSLLFNTTSDIAITTSVLFMIPGVPLINGVLDVMEGYILCGFARLTKAFLVIICIAVGLALTLWIVKNNLI